MTAEQPQESYSREAAQFPNRLAVSVHHGSDDLRNRYGRAAIGIFQDTFSKLFVPIEGYSPQASRDTFLRLLNSRMGESSTTFVALESSGKLVGFTYAVPCALTPNYPFEKEEMQQLGLTEAEYKTRQSRTASITVTVIKRSYRSKGGWSQMMDALEESLRSSGKYDEMVRVAREENRLARIIRRHPRYQGRIVTDIPHQDGPIGKQSYFRIRL